MDSVTRRPMDLGPCNECYPWTVSRGDPWTVSQGDSWTVSLPVQTCSFGGEVAVDYRQTTTRVARAGC